MKAAARAFELPGHPYDMSWPGLTDYLIGFCGFAPEEVAMYGLPPLNRETEPAWWEKFLLPCLKTKEPELVGTPLWNDLLKAVGNQKNPNPRERFWHLSRSALQTLAERRTDPQD